MQRQFGKLFILAVVLTNILAYTIYLFSLKNGPTAIIIGSIIFLFSGTFTAKEVPWFKALRVVVLSLIFFGILALISISLYMTHSINWSYILRNLTFFTFLPVSWLASFSVGLALRFAVKDELLKRTIGFSMIALFLTIISASVNLSLQVSVAGLVYMIGGYKIIWSASVRKNLVHYAILAGPFVLLFFPLTIAGNLKHAYPNDIIVIVAVLVGIGLKLLKLRGKNKWLILCTSLYLIFLLAGYYASMNWRVYTFSQKYTTPASSVNNIRFLTQDDMEITADTFRNKNVMLYFWSTSCSVCYEEFPLLEKIKSEYQNLPDFCFYAICCLNPRKTKEEEKSKALSIQYDLPVIFADASVYRDTLNINFFPFVMLIDQNGKVLYQGSFNYQRGLYINSTRRILKSFRE